MQGNDFMALYGGTFFRQGCLTFLAGAVVGIGLWVGIPAFCHWFAAHWH